jgi:hypothetical protein
MALGLNLNSMMARQVSNAIGTRQMSLSNSFFDELLDDHGNIFDKIWNFGKNVVGFLWKAAIALVKGIQFSAKEIVAWVQRVKETLWNFNWQATDKELQGTMEQYNIQVAGAWGAVVGRGIGWLSAIVVGAGIAMLVPVVGGTALAAAVTLSTGKEAIDDLTGEIKAAIAATFASLAAKAVLSGYIAVRRAIRAAALKIDWRPYGFLGGRIGSAIANWGQKPGVSWTFESATEDAIEKIDSLPLQAFVEEALEESWDAFIEGGYVVADVIDSQFEVARLQTGETKKLVLYPDNENRDEKVVLYGNASEIQTQALTTLNTHQLIRNRDIGYFDIPDTDTPLKVPSTRELKIIFYTVKQPPWSRGKRHTIKIANPKEGITYDDVKRATNTLDTGIFYASARLNGHRGKMVVHGSSADKARSNLEEIAGLCDGQLGNITVGQSIPSAKSSSIQSGSIYPAYAQLSLKKQRSTGNLYADGERYNLYGDRLTLWYDNSPIGSQSIYTWLRTRAAVDIDS